MTNVLTNVNKISQYIYSVVVINALFLITNALFFQIFFSIDFKPIFFPVYYVVSFTIFPSVIAMVKTISNYYFGESEGIIISYFRNLKTVVVNNKMLVFIVPTLTYFIVFNIYIINVNNNLRFILFFANIIILFLEGLLLVNIARVGIMEPKQKKFKLSVLLLISNSISNSILLISIGIFGFVAFTTTIYSWLFVFGLIICGMAVLFQKQHVNKK
ncbi:hypothetical protein AEQ18_07640 [Enterococcus sp. RIT-PI-f]|nr:hypothetical protein AEQ18_07640 [Enterococcus sp. RIT-PI-f]